MVSLARNEHLVLNSSYYKYIKDSWAFIISTDEKIKKTVNLFSENKKTPRIDLTNCFWNTLFGVLGKRYSCYDDEYHKFGRIRPKDIIGIKIGKEVQYLKLFLEILEQKRLNLDLMDTELGLSVKGR